MSIKSRGTLKIGTAQRDNGAMKLAKGRTEQTYNKSMNDNRYYSYLKSYVLGSLEGQKKAGLIDATRTECEHLLEEGIGVFLELAGHGYYEDHGYDIDNDKEWERQTRSYIEETIGRELTEREVSVYYGLA